MFILTVLFVVYLAVAWINISYHEDNYSKHSELTQGVSVHIRRGSFLWPIKLAIYILVLIIAAIVTLRDFWVESKR